MKKLTFLIMTGIALFLLAGCAGEEKPEENNISAEAIINNIKEHIAKDLEDNGIQDALVDGQLQAYIEADLSQENNSDDPTSAIFIEKMELDTSKLEEGTVLAAAMNINSDEIILLKAKSADDVPALKESLEKELAAQTQTWEQYLPDQYEKVQNNIIKVNGNYLLYVTYENPEAIVEIFDAQF